MDRYYCYRCDAPKTPTDLRQVEHHETCLYACRQCGSPEGVWLQRLDLEQRQVPLLQAP